MHRTFNDSDFFRHIFPRVEMTIRASLPYLFRSHVEEDGFILPLEPDIEAINDLAALFPATGT
jgi:hypothetical protein